MKNATKVISSKLLLFTAAIALCFFVAGKSLAADEPAVGENANTGKVIADVNIRNAKISETTKGTFEIAFDVENSMDVQSNLVYGLELIKKTTDGKTVFSDNKTFPDDKVTVEKGEVVKKTIIYSAPEFLSGDFKLWIKIKDQSGLTLALSSLQINLSGTGKYVEFGNPCYLTIEGENGEKYSLGQGIDLKKEEKLFFNCQASNALGGAVTLTPNFEFYLRDSFGEKISAQTDENQKISFTAKENKLVKIQIPLPEKPQAYDVKIFLNQGQKAVSNPIFAHFVLSGASATIVSASLDKNSYNSGDIAIISAILAPSADGFSGSRNGSTVLNNTIIGVTFKDANGNSCADKYQYNWTKTSYPKPDVQMEVPITKDCIGLNVSLKMLENGVLLYEKDINLKAEPKVAEKQGENVAAKTENKSTKAILVVIIVVCLIALGLLIWKLRNGRKIISILIFFVSLSLMPALPTGNAQAATTLLTGITWWMSLADSRLVGNDDNVPLSVWSVCDNAAGTDWFKTIPPTRPIKACSSSPSPAERPCLGTGPHGKHFVATDWKRPTTDPDYAAHPYYNVVCYQDAVSFTYSLNKAAYYRGETAKAVTTPAGVNLCNNGVTLGVDMRPLKTATPPPPDFWRTVLADQWFNDDTETPPEGEAFFPTGFITNGFHRAEFSFHFIHGLYVAGDTTSDTEHTISGTIGYTVQDAESCTIPWNSTKVPPGDSILAYTSPAGTCSGSCTQQNIKCNYNGSWAQPPYESCANTYCTTPWGSCLDNGSSTDAYSSASVCGLCNSVHGTIGCTNGRTLSGDITFPYGSCNAISPTYQYACTYSAGDTCGATNCGDTIITQTALCSKIDISGCSGAATPQSLADCVNATPSVPCADVTQTCPACPPSVNTINWREVKP